MPPCPRSRRAQISRDGSRAASRGPARNQEPQPRAAFPSLPAPACPGPLPHVLSPQPPAHTALRCARPQGRDPTPRRQPPEKPGGRQSLGPALFSAVFEGRCPSHRAAHLPLTFPLSCRCSTQVLQAPQGSPQKKRQDHRRRTASVPWHPAERCSFKFLVCFCRAIPPLSC